VGREVQPKASSREEKRLKELGKERESQKFSKRDGPSDQTH